VLYAISAKIFPAPWSYLVVLATVLSTVGAIETQILQFSRSMFSMSRAGVLHSRYAVVHPEWQTPWAATLVIWGFGMVLLFSSSYMPSVASILESSIEAIGLQICFYMGLTGFASAWHFRGLLKTDLRAAATQVVFPFVGGTFMAGGCRLYDPHVQPDRAHHRDRRAAARFRAAAAGWVAALRAARLRRPGWARWPCRRRSIRHDHRPAPGLRAERACRGRASGCCR